MYNRHLVMYLGQKLREYFKVEEKLTPELEALVSKLPNRPNEGELKVG